MLNIKSNDDIIFVGGADYIIPFCEMTKSLKNKKIIVYKKKLDSLSKKNLKYMERDDFKFEKFETKRNTNWYEDYIKDELLNDEKK